MAFVKSEKGIGQMLVLPGMVADMGRRAEKVATAARLAAPVDETGPHPGRYRDSIRASADIRPRSQEPPRLKVKHARARGRVTATSPEAGIVEFGTETQAAHRTLRSALRAAR